MTLLFELIIGTVVLIVLLDFFTGFRMAKSIINRIRKRTDEAAEALRDPVADAQAALFDIRQKREDMINLRKNLLLEVKRADSKVNKFGLDVAKWEDIARLAGGKGVVADVKLALEKKAVAEKELALAQTDKIRVSGQEDALQAKIAEFDSLIEKADADKSFLESSLKINRFNIEVNSVLKDSNGTALSALERLRDDVQISAFEAELSGEMVEEVKGLEGKYAVTNGVSDDDVAKYLVSSK